ncbi:MAG TPA: hypothetical protein VMW86_04310 [Dehalococcoidales bacterium]|nr:hypothetical protein [Dehalococcoidales bacterium]
MIKPRCKFSLLLAAVILLLFSLVAGCAPARDFDGQLREITGPYRFDVVKWELNALTQEAGKLFSRQESTDNATSAAATFFANVERINGLVSEIEAVRAGNRQGDLTSLEDELNERRRQNAELAGTVEGLLETQIREAFTQQGIFNPLDTYLGLRIGFPPVNIYLAKPPHLLVVSPRDRIESIREVTLLPEMSVEDMASIEAEIDSLGVSSLVVNLGGISTYPSYVMDTADARFILDTAGEEWLHQYMAFTPLGFRYVLDLTGIRQDYDIATMNETVASMVSKEIGGIIYKQHYAPGQADDAEPAAAESGFDFNKEMREIRQAVDDYLARGEIEQAEEFMEQKQQYLAENGYYIRKLNQAYFAFYGTYADSPTSISPIGAEMKELRSRSASLKDFLDTVAAMTNRQDLADSLR